MTNLLDSGHALERETHCLIQWRGEARADGPAAPLPAGVTLLDHLDATTVLARVTPSGLEQLRQSPDPLWVAAYRADVRLCSSLQINATRGTGDGEGDAPVRVLVSLLRDADSQVVVERIHAAGGAVQQPVPGAPGLDRVPRQVCLLVTAPKSALAAVAAIDGVQFVEPAPSATPRNDRTAWVVQGNVDGATPIWSRGLIGQGQHGGIIDLPVDITRCAFSDPESDPVGPNHRKVHAYRGTPGSAAHGTHVAGTFVGDRSPTMGDTFRNGMAYGARISYASLDDINADPASLIERLRDAHNDGARVHSNSWGDDSTTAYSTWSRQIDQFAWENEDDLVCMAVTNLATLRSPENAKNCLAVAATAAPPNQHVIASGGAGPTVDGRRKPEILAPGSVAQSAANNQPCGFAPLTGTSAACPAVAGMALLARQYFTEGYYPGGAANPADALAPTGALLRAVLLNAAVDMTGETGYPGNREGWGRLLIDNSLFFQGEARRLRVLDRRHAAGLAVGEQASLFVRVTDPAQPFRATLAWSDYPSAIGAAGALINDLDLIVVSPGQGTFLGNDIDTTTGESRAAGNRDAVNNVEQVVIASPLPGVYEVRVHGFAVSAPAGAPRQGFALAVTGPITSPGPLGIVFPGGVPAEVAPLRPVNVEIRIDSYDESLVPGSAVLRYRTPGGSGAFASVPLVPTGGNGFVATLPALPCGGQFDFYVSATGSGGSVVTHPAGAPGSFHTAAATGIVSDCNQNGVDDLCDTAAGTSTDCGGNGIPDECETPLRADAGPDQVACLGGAPIVLGAEAPATGGTAPYVHQWTILSGPALDGLDDPAAARPRFTPSAAGEYVVELAVTDGTQTGCTRTDTVVIRAAQLAVQVMGDRSVGRGREISLGGPGVVSGGEAPYAYQWQVVAPADAPAELADAQSESARFTGWAAGEYTVQLAVTDADGCTAIASSRVVVTASGGLFPPVLPCGACGPSGLTVVGLAAGIALVQGLRRRRRERCP